MGCCRGPGARVVFTAMMMMLPAVCVLLLVGQPLGPTDGIGQAEFDELHRKLIPDRAKPWESIPWRIDLAKARRESAVTGKPLFMWAMNGHPLGCT